MSQLSVSGMTGREPSENIFHIQNQTIANPLITIGKVGWWSAVLTALCGAGYGIAVIAVLVASLSSLSSSSAQGWTGIDSFLATFQPIQMMPLIPSLLLAPAFTALMVSIHSYATEDKKI